MKALFLERGFLRRASLLELAFAWFAVTCILQLFNALLNEIVLPFLLIFSWIPDISSLHPFGIAIGPFISTAAGLIAKVAILYFLMIYPRSNETEKTEQN